MADCQVDTETMRPDDLTAFGHFDFSDAGYGKGFPVVLPVSSDYEEVQALLKYMKDGHYFDDDTKTLTVHVVTYNGHLDLFCDVFYTFEMKTGKSPLSLYPFPWRLAWWKTVDAL